MTDNYGKELLDNCLNLYIKGTLEQYGLSKSAALEIVSNLTKVSPEQLESLRQERINRISGSFNSSNDVLKNLASR